jgi:F0F1-type ATP synthase membrane subunit c/vacuolar-type H+-ATPase subunit K
VTAFTVDPAAQVESPEYPQPVDNTMTIVGIGAAILAAIAIVGVVLAMLLMKKRP